MEYFSEVAWLYHLGGYIFQCIISCLVVYWIFKLISMIPEGKKEVTKTINKPSKTTIWVEDDFEDGGGSYYEF